MVTKVRRMPTDKQTHKLNRKNKQHKKCGAKIAGAPACRHTAKKNGRCQAHSALAMPLLLKKEAEKKLANKQKRQQALKTHKPSPTLPSSDDE